MRWLLALVFGGCTFGARTSNAPPDASDDDGDPNVDTMMMIDAQQPAVVSFSQGTALSGNAGQLGVTLTQPIVDGDLAVIGIGTNGGTVTGVTDSGNNTYTSLGANGGQVVYVAPAMHAAANDTITVTFSNTTGYTMGVAIYRGLARTSPVDATVSASGNGTMFDSGAASTSHPHDLLVGVAASNGTMTPGASFMAHAGGQFSLIEAREVTTTGSYRAAVNASGSSQMWTLRLVALEAND